MTNIPTEPGFYQERTSGKYYRVWRERHTQGIDAACYLSTYESSGPFVSGDRLPPGDYVRLVPERELGEAKAQAQQYLFSQAANWSVPDCRMHAANLAELFAGVPENDTIKKLYDHAITCVDRVFQKHDGNRNPILPDFLPLGANKFDGVVKLAEEYRKAEQAIARQDEIADLNKTIDGKNAEIARLVKTCDEFMIAVDDVAKILGVECPADLPLPVLPNFVQAVREAVGLQAEEIAELNADMKEQQATIAYQRSKLAVASNVVRRDGCTAVWMVDETTSAARDLACKCMDAMGMDSANDFRTRDKLIVAIGDRLDAMLNDAAAQKPERTDAAAGSRPARHSLAHGAGDRATRDAQDQGGD